MTPTLARSVLVATFVVAVLAVIGVGQAVDGRWSASLVGGAPAADRPAPAAPADDRPPRATARPDEVPSGAQLATIDRVVDGDTIRVRIADHGGPIPPTGSAPVRLLNADTPEARHPQRGVECGGPEAATFLEDLLPSGTPVWLAMDRSDTDRYDRHLRAVWTDDGVFVNAALVEAGLGTAVLFPPDDRWYADLVAREADARAVGAGNWSRCP